MIRRRSLASYPKISPSLRKRAAQIKVLLMDVDGTMTIGGVTLLSQTEEIALEIKTFDAHDGQGLTLAHTAGLRTGCITGRQSSALLRRSASVFQVGAVVGISESGLPLKGFSCV